MEKRVLVAFGLWVTAGLVSAAAYAEPGGMKAKVPFEFVAGGKTLPAGEYRIVAAPHRVDIQDAQGKKVAVILANEISGGEAGENGKVVFRCYREGCFLTEVWSPDYEHGEFVSSRTNKEKNESGKYVAVLGEK
jgi:hypothetical protein